MAVDATDPASGPRLVLHPAAGDRETSKSGLRPILLTDDHDEQTRRLTGLGATVVTPRTQAPGVRLTSFADPDGNGFDLVTFQSE
jgi:predicted enzyme related to lactoylglutathione lyase